MRRALEYVKAFDGVVAQHAQEPRLTEDAQMNEGELSGRLGLSGWPAVAEEAIIARDCLLAAHVGSRLHVCHVVHRRLGRDRPLGQDARAGTSPPRSRPHHLLLTDELAATYDPIYKVNPPLRIGRRRRRRCATALADGTIDVVATDHAPHPHEDKDCEWAAAAFGMLGLRPRCRSCRRRWSTPGCSTGPGSPSGCPHARRGSAGSPATAGRSRWGSPPTWCSYDPAAARGRGRRPGLGVALAQHAVRRSRAARPGGRDVPARVADRAGREARRDGARRSSATRDGLLVLEDGRTFRGESSAAPGRPSARRCSPPA